MKYIVLTVSTMLIFSGYYLIGGLATLSMAGMNDKGLECKKVTTKLQP